MNFLKIKISDLLPASYNPRKNLKEHDTEYKKIKKSIEEFGYVEPIIINSDNTVIGGHQRLKVLQELGHTEVDVIQIDIDKTKEKALNVALNKISGEWDTDKLSDLLDDLKLDDFDIELTGFDLSELEDLFPAEEKEIKEDDYEVDLPEEPKSKVGDVYILGNHRLMCGDSTRQEDVERLMNGVYPDLIHTDPPYGMNAVTRSGVLSKTYKIDIIGDDNPDIAKIAFNLIFNMYSKAKHVWWGANYYSSVLNDSESWIVWDKNNGESDQTDCELAWGNFRSVVRKFTRVSEKINRVHPTQKPISLIEWIIRKFKVEGNVVADFFGGSGSTLIACEQLNRKCFMMELDPKYVDVIIDRWEKYTGNKAVKE